MLDTLTHIPSFNSLLQTLKESKHPKLFLIDLKDFTKLNLTYSDEAGDFVLKEFALSLTNFAKNNNMSAFRVQEDEFALIKDIPFDLKTIEKLLFLVIDFIKAQKYNFNKEEITIKAHMGICLDQNNLLKKAQKALKIAQKENQPFMTYSDFVNILLEEDEERICTLLHDSIEDGTITPYFQKVINLDKNTLYQEALIRIVSKNGVIPPKIFLNIAKEKGFYTQIVKLVIGKMNSIKEAKAVNISCSELFDDELYQIYTEGFKNSNTVFELQNEECLHNSRLPEKIAELKKLNIKICLDNVDNTSYIKDLEIEFVKIKGDLIRLLQIDANAVSTCKKIISTCKEQNIKTIATHINSNASFEEAQKLGFDYYQGFYFEKPTCIVTE